MTVKTSAVIHTDASKSFDTQLLETAKQYGFSQIGVCDIDTKPHQQYIEQWLEEGKHGDMEWMKKHLDLRFDPSKLLANAKRVISIRMDYLPETTDAAKLLTQADKAYVSRYALGRDYHKLMRNRLAKLAKQLATQFPGNYRAAVDSAPVLERYFAQKNGLGWIGKNTMLMNRHAGSWFFLGEIITDAELPLTNTPINKNHCGRCTACLDICPTNAFDGAYKLDATKCISYLTIELKDDIPEEYRDAIGNRVFGCDDCQLVCPWNRFAKFTQEDDFSPRHKLNNSTLADLAMWSEQEFLNRTAGSPIRRLGYERWQRNLAVGLGNAKSTHKTDNALNFIIKSDSRMVQRHAQWAQMKLKSC